MAQADGVFGMSLLTILNIPSCACASSSELALEILIILASGLEIEDEELNLLNTGAGGKGNIVFEIFAVGGETGRESNDLGDEFSDSVTLWPWVMLGTLLV